MQCGRCERDGYPLARIIYRRNGVTRRTMPLCLDCRHTARRRVWRDGGQVLHTQASSERDAS
jgi:hypothetical protein